MHEEHPPADNKNFQEQSGDVSLLTLELRNRLPPLYSQEHNLDPMVEAKFYFPGPSGWAWYAFEGSPVDANGYMDTNEEKVDYLFFGWVVGWEKEIGYFALSELEAIKAPTGEIAAHIMSFGSGIMDIVNVDLSGLATLKVIRDDTFTPMPLSDIKKHHGE
jgi:hypothetical protein